MRKILVLLLLLVMPVRYAETQSKSRSMERAGNPKITVPINHPPSLPLNLKRVALAPPSGQCSDELADLLLEGFIKNKVEVVDRQNMASLLTEHKFSLSGYVDQTSVAKLGKILGPSVLVFLKVQRCSTEKNSLRDVKRYQNQVVYISRTQAFLKGSLQAVDLSTGKIFTAKAFEVSPKKEYYSEQGQPEFYSSHELESLAIQEASAELQRMFFPWTENRSLLFFDDNDCGLKQAFHRLRATDLPGVLQLSEKNLAGCKEDPKTKPKVLSHALYNVGMSHFLLNNYDKALGYFNDAAGAKESEIISEAIVECRRAKDLAAEMDRVEERMVVEAASSRSVQVSAGGTTPAETGSPKTEQAPAKDTIEDRLRKLDDLFKKGLITKEDHSKRKAQILSEL